MDTKLYHILREVTVSELSRFLSHHWNYFFDPKPEPLFSYLRELKGSPPYGSISHFLPATAAPTPYQSYWKFNVAVRALNQFSVSSSPSHVFSFTFTRTGTVHLSMMQSQERFLADGASSASFSLSGLYSHHGFPPCFLCSAWSVFQKCRHSGH